MLWEYVAIAERIIKLSLKIDIADECNSPGLDKYVLHLSNMSQESPSQELE
ncbi:MAG: hypothetical protein WCO29_11445 [Nostocales cyanobacterium ELA583]